jgi:2OG-Fe(II) oxygenase superfamily
MAARLRPSTRINSGSANFETSAAVDNFLEVREFAEPDDCAAVIAAYERSWEKYGVRYPDPFFARRVMWINSFPDHENPARQILQRWRHKATRVACDWAGHQVVSDTIQVLAWRGEVMRPHRDHCHADGSPNPTPWRQWAGVIYLNDGYSGGHLAFPEFDRTYQPIAGAFVLFPSHYLHGVAASSGVPRYTSPMWFTNDLAREDPWARVSF